METRQEAVLLLHGLWMNRLAMLYIARKLDRAGFLPVSLAYRSMRESLDEHLAAVARRIESIAVNTIHLLGHSYGGVVAIHYLQNAPDARIGRTVLLGAPIAGCLAARSLARRRGGQLLLGRSLAIWRSDTRPRLDERFCVGAIAGSRPIGLAGALLRLPVPSDGVVTVDETHLPGLAGHIVLPVSHSSMLISSRVAGQVAAFLRSGRFEP